MLRVAENHHPSRPSAGREHYITLFDDHFLVQALCLRASLLRHGAPFRLWALCMDEAAEAHLRRLALPEIGIIPLREVETEALRAVRPGRSAGEYCWTMTPFCAEAVFARAPEAERATYLDADLAFFASPAPFFAEFAASGKDVLITEHGFAPEYDKRECGRFCVQFLTVRNTAGGRKVMHWWQERCVEWCFGRVEDGKFGDQAYLDSWPERFAAEVHILSQVQRTLAPWNIDHVARNGRADPVFYHFHSLRRIPGGQVRLWNWDYRLGAGARPFYAAYVADLRQARDQLAAAGIAIPPARAAHLSLRQRLRAWRQRLLTPGVYQAL
jgi:hypothetical protein